MKIFRATSAPNDAQSGVSARQMDQVHNAKSQNNGIYQLERHIFFIPSNLWAKVETTRAVPRFTQKIKGQRRFSTIDYRETSTKSIDLIQVDVKSSVICIYIIFSLFALGVSNFFFDEISWNNYSSSTQQPHDIRSAVGTKNKFPLTASSTTFLSYSSVFIEGNCRVLFLALKIKIRFCLTLGARGSTQRLSCANPTTTALSVLPIIIIIVY